MATAHPTTKHCFVPFISMLLMLACVNSVDRVFQEDTNRGPSSFSSEDSMFLNLDGEWQIQLLNSSKSLKVNGDVPGNVYSALYKSDVIGYPYYAKNDEKYRWIARNDWSYSRSFKVSKNLLTKSNIDIIFEGLDTVATVHINGQLVGKAENMFVKYIFSIKDKLKDGENLIEVRFQSPIKYAQSASVAFEKTYGYMVPPVTRPAKEHGDKHVNFIRKEPCSFAWDWGPAFPTLGIWKSVSIEAYDSATLDYIIVDTIKRGNGWIAEVTVISHGDKAEGGLKLKVEIPELDQSKMFDAKVTAGESVNKVTLSLENYSKLEEWWPRGFGEQNLYELKVSLCDSKESVKSLKSVRLGFRTIELVEEKIEGSQGLSFYFKINSVPIFLKGSNWIPADSFKDNVTEDKVKNILQSAADANMNVLRVWGGGIYEDDFFYSLADKMGILLWHDFMFACAMYPADEPFLKNVSSEIRHQVRRLQYHPSILIWSGNNENEVALRQDWYGTGAKFEQFQKDYVKLYVDTVKKVVENEDKSRPFIVSSPSNGKQSEEKGGIADDPQSPSWGDVHFYDYFSDCMDVNVFPNPRMSTEYGYQSYPSYDVLKEIAEPSDLEWDSPLMKYRQHHEQGNQQIQDMVLKHFKLPGRKNATFYFKGMIFLSQVMQALCIKQETEHYRRLRGNLINGMGHTMGAMYWQLNDIWQGPSWSSLEYGGKWKVLHYFAKDFFAPVMASAYKDNEKLIVYVISDKLTTISNALLKIETYQWTSFEPSFTKEKKISISPASSTSVVTMPLNETCPEVLKCVVLVSLDVKGSPTQSTFVLVASPKDAVGMKNPGLKIKRINVKTQNTFELELESNFPAIFVWLSSTTRGRFSDNGFLMVKSQMTINFHSWEKADLESFKQSLEITSLYDLYN